MSSNYFIDGLDEMEQALARMVEEEYPAEFRALVIQIAEELAGRIKEHTPKDTGHLRREWKVGKIKRAGNGYSIEVYNNVEYAEPVEYGHRTRGKKSFVEGAHMLELSLEEVSAALPGFLQDWLSEFLNTHEL